MENQGVKQQTDKAYFTTLNNLYEKILAVVGKVSVLRTCPAGTFLFYQGWESRAVYFVESGIVKMTHTDEDGKESIIALRSRGYALGISAILLSKHFQLSAITLTDCQLHIVSSERFLALLKTDAEFSLYLHQLRSYEYHAQFGLRFGTARQRLENLLTQLIPMMGMNESQRNLQLHLPVTQYDIAGLIDTNHTYISKLLGQLEKEEIIQRKNGFLLIPNPQTLRRMKID